MRTNARMLSVLTLVTVAALTAGAAVVGADDLDFATARAEFADGDAELEYEPRNTEPMVCFIIRHDAPDSGDSIHTTIHRGSPARPGPEVIDLSVDGWFGDQGSGCMIPSDPAAAERLFDPGSEGDYYLQFQVIEHQGTPVQRGPFRGVIDRVDRD